MRGYRLVGESYELITNSRSKALGLRLEVEGKLIEFYQEDTGEKLLIPEELWSALEESQEIAQRERQRAEVLAAQLRSLGIEPEA